MKQIICHYKTPQKREPCNDTVNLFPKILCRFQNLEKRWLAFVVFFEEERALEFVHVVAVVADPGNFVFGAPECYTADSVFARELAVFKEHCKVFAVTFC